MKTKLQQAIAKIAPSIYIATNWEHDPDSGPVSMECDGFDSSEDDDWEAWQSEVRATAIVGGEEITGHAYLGGTFERAGDLPEYSNPTISGYEPQMTVEALKELAKQLPEDHPDLAEIEAAQAYLKQFMADEYAAQQAARLQPVRLQPA